LQPHRNAAVTVALGLEQPFRLRFLEDTTSTRWRRTHAAVIPSGCMHHLRAAGPMGFIYLDPLTDDHRRLTPHALVGAHERVRALLLQQPAASVDDACVALGIPRRIIGDARVARVLRELEARPEAFPKMAEAAAKAGLSPSRFRALFQQHVGLPFRRYRLWRRMAVVASLVREGTSLTQAALAAGFSSSAHLSSAFHEMFGLSPSALLVLDIQIDVERECRATPRRANRSNA
ncbi:MAG TPA: helix-turn-helix transcriptional regulator, partial [Polyangiales bacterium]|nr:helix-turn-helix transcriptional regulator [Polyangiales bacterium]